LFIAGAAGLGFLMGPLMPGVVLLGVGSILLSLGLMAFSAAIAITAKLVTPDKIAMTLNTLGAMTQVFVSLGLLIIPIALGTVAATLLSAASIVLLLGISAFGLAMVVGNLIKPELIAQNSSMLLKSTALFAALIPAGLMALAATPFIALFTVASLALALMTVPLGITLTSLNKINPLVLPAIGTMKLLILFMNTTAIAMGLSTVASVAIMLTSSVVLPASLALMAITGALFSSVSKLSSLDKRKVELASLNIDMIFNKVLIPFGFQATAAAFSLMLAMPAILIITTISSSLFNAVQSVASLMKLDINKEKIENNLAGLSTVMTSFTQMKTPNPIQMAVIGASIIPITDAMRGMIKVVKDLQGIPEKDIENAKGGIQKLGNLITSENKNDWSFNKLLQQMDGIGGGKVRASQALGNVVDVVDKLTGIITKMGGVIDTQAALISMRGIGDTILYLNNQVLDKINGIPRDIQERIGKVIESSSLIKDKLLPNLRGWAISPDSGIGQAIEHLKKMKEIPDTSRTLRNIADSINRLDIKKIQGIGDAFSIIKNNVDLQGRLDPVIQFANRSGDFNKIADAFQKIANSVGQIDAKKGLFTSLGSIDGGKFSANATGLVAGETRESPHDGEIVKKLSEVYELLKNWYSRDLKPSTNDYSTPITALEPARNNNFLLAAGVS
jgi:hypothetical protein